MTDPYGFDNSEGSRRSVANDRNGRRSGGSMVLRGFLWLVLVLSAAGNAIASLGGMDTPIRLAFGVVTVLCIIGLVVHHLRNR